MRLGDRLARVSAVVLMTMSVAAPAAFAASRPWMDADSGEFAGLQAERRIAPVQSRVVRIDAAALEALLAAAPGEFVAPDGFAGVELAIPRVDGGELALRVVDSSIMEPELQAKFPEIRTYRVFDPADRTIRGRIDWTPHGFHAMVRTPEGLLYVDPYRPGDRELHQAYFAQDLVRGPEHAFRCDTHAPAEEAELLDLAPLSAATDNPTGGIDLRTYRTAVAATVEYTAFHGGTVPLGMAAIVTAMNRVNGVYEREVAIRMILVANNNLVVYTAEPRSVHQQQRRRDAGPEPDRTSTWSSAPRTTTSATSSRPAAAASRSWACRVRPATRRAASPACLRRSATTSTSTTSRTRWGTSSAATTPSTATRATASAATATPRQPTSRAAARRSWPTPASAAPQDLQPHSDPYFHYKSLEQIGQLQPRRQREHVRGDHPDGQHPADCQRRCELHDSEVDAVHARGVGDAGSRRADLLLGGVRPRSGRAPEHAPSARPRSSARSTRWRCRSAPSPSSPTCSTTRRRSARSCRPTPAP